METVGLKRSLKFNLIEPKLFNLFTAAVLIGCLLFFAFTGAWQALIIPALLIAARIGIALQRSKDCICHSCNQILGYEYIRKHCPECGAEISREETKRQNESSPGA